MVYYIVWIKLISEMSYVSISVGSNVVIRNYSVVYVELIVCCNKIINKLVIVVLK